MRNLCLCILIIFGLCVIQACNKKGKNTATVNADSISSADSLNAINSSAKINTHADSMDVQFVMQAAKGCITEAELGKLALRRAQNKRVRNFGAIMIKDITKADNKLIALAKSKHITLPAAPDSSAQKTIDGLAKKSGKDFDNAYTNEVIRDHATYLILFKNESKNSTDPDIKAFATKAVRIIKNHLDAINTIHESMK